MNKTFKSNSYNKQEKTMESQNMRNTNLKENKKKCIFNLQTCNSNNIISIKNSQWKWQ